MSGGVNYFYFNIFVWDKRQAYRVIHVFIIVQCTADLEAMQLEAQAKDAAHNARVLQHQMELENKLRELENRCETMKKAEMQMKQRNEADRQQFEKEKQDVILPCSSSFDLSFQLLYLLVCKLYHVLII